MGYTTFATLKRWIAPGWGQCDNESLTDAANRCREIMYNMYADLPLFLDAVECFRVHRYCLDCNTCSSSYSGITLPREAQQVEAMWLNDWPVTLRSSWREYQAGISPECACRLEKIDMPGAFSMPVDIPPNQPKHLVVMALNAEDVGKSFTIRGMATTGQPFSQAFSLTTDPQRTSYALKYVDHRGGILKDITAGRVLVMDDDSNIYGQYEPDETVPSYRRIKITGLADNCSVLNVRCSRKYFPLAGNNDVVETDNHAAFDALARYLRLYTKSDKSRDDMIVEKDHLSTARAHLFGQHSREQGKATLKEVRMQTPNINRTRLRRTR